MRKSHVRFIRFAILLVVLFAVAACNDQSPVKSDPISPEDQKEVDVIARLLFDLQKAFAALDVDRMMTFYSDDYEGSRGENKREIRRMMERMIESGSISGSEMSIEDVIIDVEGDTATVLPIKYATSMGTLKIENTIKKINGTWKLTQGRLAY